MNIRRFIWAAVTATFAVCASAQTVLDSPELYAGEKTLYEAAKKEGMVVSFDTGPTWANWAAQLAQVGPVSKLTAMPSFAAAS